MLKRTLVLVLCLLVVAPAFAVKVQGVELPDAVEVGGKSLGLVGTALRKVTIIKVYVAALYLAAPSASGDAVLAADAPRQIVNHYLRDAGGERVCDGWKSGLADNTPDASAEIVGQFDELCAAMGDVEKGDRFVFTYAPGAGTTLEVNGKKKASFEGKEFADALFACWIGPDPGPGEGFKNDLLGL